MPYQHTTWGTLKAELLIRLGDSVFWTDDTTVRSEVGSYLEEALRFWGAATMRWRERVTLPLEQNVSWYDLYQKIPFLEHRVTDQHLLLEIQHHLLEQIDEDGWAGTAQFTATEIQSALQRRRDQFLFELGLVQVVHETPAQSIDSSGRVEIKLNPPIIDLRRVAWVSFDGTHSALFRSAESDYEAYDPGWIGERGTPDSYSMALSRPLTIQLNPIPNAPGRVEFVGVQGGAALNITTGIKIGVPDDLSWAVKWGALADLLGKQGIAYDPTRAEYCERRWAEAMEIAKAYRTVLSPVRVDGVTTPTSTVFSLDTHRPGWEDEAAGAPESVAISGYNILAVAPKPNASPHSISLDVVRPAQIPSSDSEFVQIGPEEVDVILDYAEHIASFKMAGEEFGATGHHYGNIMRLAIEKNAYLRAAWARKEATDEAAIGDAALRTYKAQPTKGVADAG